MKILKRTISIVVKILVIIILPVAVFISVTSKTDIIAGIRSYVVESGSMAPTLPVGSIIFDRKAPLYQKGDMITFTRSGQTVTHRIKTQKNGQFQVQGDANKIPDEALVATSDIQGKVIFMIPYLGWVSAFLKTLYGLLLFIILPCSILILLELFNMKKHIEVATEERLRKKLSEEHMQHAK